MQRYTVYFIWKLLYMFRVVTSPIIRSAYNCMYSIWYLSHPYCYLPLSWKSWNWCWDAVDTVVCAPDDGWKYHPKHAEQFPYKINCVTLHLVGYILKYEFKYFNKVSFVKIQECIINWNIIATPFDVSSTHRFCRWTYYCVQCF